MTNGVGGCQSIFGTARNADCSTQRIHKTMPVRYGQQIGANRILWPRLWVPSASIAKRVDAKRADSQWHIVAKVVGNQRVDNQSVDVKGAEGQWHIVAKVVGNQRVDNQSVSSPARRGPTVWVGVNPSSARRGMPTAAPAPALPDAYVSCRPSAFRAVCVYAICRRRSTSPSHPYARPSPSRGR